VFLACCCARDAIVEYWPCYHPPPQRERIDVILPRHDLRERDHQRRQGNPDHLYEREGKGSDGNPDDVAAKVRADGGIADSQMVGDTEAAVKWMRAQPNHNGKVGVFGSCSGGRHAFIYACQKKDVDACVELWGGRVVMGKEELNPKTPVAPIDMTKDLCCPLLGLFGNDDRAPSPEQVNQHEAELKKHGKAHEFHRYDGAGHGFFYWHRPLYRPEQAMDGWSKVWAFFGKHLAK
jgi:carboxymethylenebutenolidase